MSKPKPTTLILDLITPVVGQPYVGVDDLVPGLAQKYGTHTYLGQTLDGLYICQRSGQPTVTWKALFPLSYMEQMALADRYQATPAFRAHCRRVGLKVPR